MNFIGIFIVFLALRGYNECIKEQKDMNVYDFDETIYNGDSTRDFVKWCMKKHPKALLSLPCTGFYTLRYYLFHIGTAENHRHRLKGGYTYRRIHRAQLLSRGEGQKIPRAVSGFSDR